MRQTFAAYVALMALVVVACGVLGCGRKAPAADVAAELGGQPIPYAEFEVYLAANAIVETPSFDSQVLSGLFDQFLEERMLSRLAADAGIEESAAGAAVARLVSESVGTVSRAEVEAYFRANPDQFLRAERIRLRQVLVESRETAELAARELADGVAFEEVARKHSQGPRSDQGGDQGVLTRDDLPPEIAARIFGLKEGETSGIIAAEYGFHLFQIAQRFPEAAASLDAAAPAIVELLEERKRGQTTRELLDRAVKRYNMRLYGRNLPFQYLGKYG